MRNIILAVVLIIIAVGLYGFSKVRTTHAPEVVDENVGAPVVQDQETVAAVFPESEYVKPEKWPPVVSTLNETYSCVEVDRLPGERPGDTHKVLFNGKEYCVTRTLEGAAGSVFAQYAYATAAREPGKTIVATFATHTRQCGVYEEPQLSQCRAGQGAFNIMPVIATVLSK